MMRKLSLLLCGAAFGAAVTAVATEPRLVLGAHAAATDTYRQLNLFGDVFERVRSDYVEQPDDAKLIEAAVNGMLTSLDPHSSYMDAKAFKDMQEQTKGEFGGLGIEVTQENNAIKVVTPIDDTPAARAGVQAGDIIIGLDNEPVQGMTLQQAVDKMRGPINTPITLKIKRAGKDDPIEIKIVRDLIRPKPVKARKEGDDVGYLRITQFNEQTTEALKEGIAEISKSIPDDKLKGYVIDLRNNPGGLLDQAIFVSDAFLEKGEIVSTRGRKADDVQRFTARAGDLLKGKPIIVLVNGGSASASEIVAGALQDHKRATILGTRSFGKGSVQTIIPLSANGALRLTTARYYTPSGRSIQAKGIEPEIEIKQNVPDELKGKDETKGEAGLKGHLPNSNTEEAGGSSAYVPPDQKDDTQLNAAYELLRGTQKNAFFPPDPTKALPN